LEKRAGDDQTLKEDIIKTREWARNTKGIKSTELKDAITKLEERITPPAQHRSSKKGG